MTAKLHRTNTNFAIAYFIAGRCHTADAAYAELLNLREDRLAAISISNSYQVRRQATRMRIEQRLKDPDPIERLEAQADLIDFEHSDQQHQQLRAAAEQELAFINECIDRINPYRKYKDLSDHDAAEACQRDEWALELRRRAENYLITQGYIPHNEFDTMRQHPDFAQNLLPYIEQLQLTLQQPEGHRALLVKEQPNPIAGLLGLEEHES